MLDKDQLFKIGLEFRANKDPNKRWNDLNDQYGCPFRSGEHWRDYVRKRLKREHVVDNEDKKIHIELNDKDFKDDFDYKYKSTVEIKSDGLQVSDKLIKMSEEESKDVEFLLKAHGYDPKVWELVSARNNIWNVYSKIHGVQVLYSSKIVVKPRKDNITFEELAEHFEQLSKKYTGRYNHIQPIKTEGHVLEIPIMDLHLGKLGWHREIGEDYDYKIAEKRFIGVIQDIIDRTKHYNFEKIIFPIGQDFFNFSTIDGATINGTRQDNDLRWQKLFLRGVELLVQAIDMLSQVAPVESFYVAGNHDKTTSYYAVNYLYAWFRNNPNVIIDRSPTARKYVSFGKCLIGYSHGDTEKQRIKGIMQIEAAEAWGKSKFREWHLGHLHSEHVTEENGLIIRRISSITGSDAWHYESGYVGAIKKVQAFIWDKEYGLIDILNSIII